MQTKFLKKIVEEVEGVNSGKIVDLLLKKKKDVNEFLIAKNLGLTINQTRNLLYKLSYLGILVIIPLIIVKNKNDFIKFHLKQGLTLFIAGIIIWAALMILMFIPYIGMIFVLISWLIWLLILIVVIVALVKAVTGNKWKIPLIYQISKGWKF